MKQIACTNCGAKYKLPDSFSADKAKCKACGSVIDVAAQRAAEADSESKPAAGAKPAKAKPASARRASAKAGAEKPSRARATTDDGGTKPKRRQRTRGAGRTVRDAESDQKKSNNALIIGSIVGLIVVAAALFFFVFGGDEPMSEPAAKKPADETTQSADAGGTPSAEEPARDGPVEAANAADEPAEPAEAASNRPEQPTPPTKSPSKDPQTKEEVFDPKRDLEPLEWPADIADQAEAMIELVQAMVDGGFPAIRAKESLADAGRPAVFALVNRMREIDFFDLYETMDAFEFTKLLRGMTKDCYPVPFDMTDDEEIPLAVAHKNALSVRDWHKMATKYAMDAESWSAFMSKIEEAAKKKSKDD